MDNKEDEIRISGIVKESTVDGPGFRYVVFTQGCPHKCKGCHNPQTHDNNGGKIVKISDIVADIQKNPLLKGITISGGDPFVQAKKVAKLLEMIDSNRYDNIVYTGFKYEDLIKNANDENGFINLLEKTDILIDGKFEIEHKSLSVPFRGSTNQRAIDVKETMKTGQIVEHDF